MGLSENEFVSIVGVAGTLFGVVIGCALTHLSDYFKSKRETEDKLNAIALEVLDIEDNLKHAISANLERAMECLKPENSLSLILPAKQYMLAYEAFFKSVLNSISTEHRRNLSSFANEVRNYNSALLELENAVKRGVTGQGLAIRFHLIAVVSSKIVGMARWMQQDKKNVRFKMTDQEFSEFDNLLDGSLLAIKQSNF